MSESRPVWGCYLRLSLDRDGTYLGVDRQRGPVHELVARFDGVPADYVDNSVSASRTRKADSDYARLVTDIRAGRLAGVAVWDLDRLTRLPREIEDWLDWAQGIGVPRPVRLVTVDGEVDANTENGRLFMRIKAAVARSEIERMASRQRAAYRQQAGRGIPKWNHRPFGYRIEGTGAAREVVTVPAEANALRKALADVLSGVAILKVCRDLNAAGWRTPTGGLWNQKTLVRNLLALRNTGVLEYRGQVANAAAWEPLWPEEQRQQMLTFLKDPARRTALDSRPRHLLTSIMKCGKCGAGISVGRVSAGSKKGQQVYRCPGNCMTRNRELLDHVVTASVLKHLAETAHPATDATADRSVIQAERDEMERRRAVLAGLIADGALPPEQGNDQIRKIAARLDELEASVVVPQISPFRRWLHGADSWDALPLVQKRALLRGEAETLRMEPLGRGPKATPENPGVTIRWRQREPLGQEPLHDAV